ncbi:hypothetical protein [Acinetobacter gyllenbergii]|uniref:hypothetical protein n=1 Tax=Acinetobacter gyllenbergii TaxID=134534 RepID=UPI003F55075C
MIKGNLFILTIISLSTSTNCFAAQAENSYNLLTQQVKGAYSVLTQQKAIGSQQQAESAKNAHQALATAIGAINMSDRLLKFMVNDAGRLGSSQTTSCIVFADQQAEKIKRVQSSIYARDMVSSFMKVMMSNSSEAEATRIERHKNYCSIAEANMGICAILPNGLQSGDSNYSLAFRHSKLQSDNQKAATDYIANIVDNRYSAQDICSNTQCLSKQIDYITRTSGNSLSAYVLSNQVSQRLPYNIGGQ